MFIHASPASKKRKINVKEDKNNQSITISLITEKDEIISSRKSWFYSNAPKNLPKNETDYASIIKPLNLNFDNIYECGKMHKYNDIYIQNTDTISVNNNDNKNIIKPTTTFYDGTQIDGDRVVLKDYYLHYKYKACLHPSVHQLFNRIGTRQRTTTWLTIRRTKITASQLSCVLADSSCKNFWAYRFRNMYRNKSTLLKDKLRVDDIQSEDNSYKNMIMNHGVINESVAIRRAMDLYNIPILHETNEKGDIEAIDFGLLEHPKYHYIAGSPDGVTMDGSLIEVKCPWSEKKKNKMHAGMVPDQYYIQMQVLMEIMNLRQAYFINYTPADAIRNEKCCITIVPRNKLFFHSLLLPLATDFHTELMLLMKQNAITTTTSFNDDKKDKIDKIKKIKIDPQIQAHQEFIKEANTYHPTFNNGQKLNLYVQRDSEIGTIHSFKVVNNDNNNRQSYGCS